MGLTTEEQGRLDQEASRGIAVALLPLLPPGWRAEMPSRDHAFWAELVHAAGMRILVRVGGWRNEGRVSFKPQWPTYADGRTYTTPDRYRPVEWRDGLGYTRGWGHPHDEKAADWSITVSAKREPKAMARELMRRLLPAYETMYAVAAAEARATDGHTEEAGIIAKSLATIIGGSVVEKSGGTHDPHHIRTPGTVVGRLRVAAEYGGTLGAQPCRVDFEVHGLDPETAARCLAVIREAEETQRQGDARTRVAEFEPPVRIAAVEDLEPEESAARAMCATAMS